MSRRSSRVGTAALVVVVVGLIWWISRGSRTDTSADDQTVPVVAAAASQGNFVDYESQPGTVTPSKSVLVRSRVDGLLTRIAFSGGQMVKQGDLLAEVDPRPLQAQAQLAAGDLARVQAQLANAQDTLSHYQTLLAQNSISRQRVADQESLVRQYAAQVKSYQGQTDTANLQLSNSRITSPISGVVGLRRVDPGNLVGPSDTHGIVVVTQSQPSKVQFSVPVDVVAPVLKQLHAGACVPVQAYSGSGNDALATGHLLAVNNEVDPSTGTVKFEAEFENTDGVLIPNQFVTAKLPVRVLSNATLVPAAAIQQGADGAFVYTIKEDKSAAVVPVKVGPTDGKTTVITSGITPGTKVVIEGADRLRAGVKVKLTGQTATASAETSVPQCELEQAPPSTEIQVGTSGAAKAPHPAPTGRP